jgi:hypothetical protein
LTFCGGGAIPSSEAQVSLDKGGTSAMSLKIKVYSDYV